MNSPLKHCIIASLLAGLFTTSVIGQDRTRNESVEKTLKLLKAPVTPAELWDAIKFSLNVGKHADAALYLDRFLASDPPAELLLTIRERDAGEYFPKLAATPELQQRAIELLRLIERAAQDRARDPERIQKFIDYLSRTPQHRAYGISQLRNAGPYAVPHLLAALSDPSLAEHHMVILQAMQKLDSSAVPPLVAALAAPDMALVTDVVEVLSVLGDADTVPHLRYLAEAPEVPQAIQSRVRSAIERIMDVRYADLPSAPEMITAQAERYYQHKVDLKVSSAGTVQLWRWIPPEGLKVQDVLPSYAEAYFGLGHCRQVLALNPGYEPAQIVFLSLALEKATEVAGIDQPPIEGPGQASALALVAGPDLVLKVLARAIHDEHPSVVLAALRALAKIGDANMLAGKNGVPSPVLHALSMSDRRIQFAAAEAVLSLGSQQPVAGTTQVITILAQALATDGTPKALVIDANSRRGSTLSTLVSQAGYDSRFVTNAREGFAKAASSIDFDLVLIDANIYDPELSPTLASFRNDPRTRAIPIAVLGNGDPPQTADQLELSLRSGDVEQVLGLLDQLGAKVSASTLDSVAKDAVHKQIGESTHVLRRFVKYVQIMPPSRAFMTLYLAELDKIIREIKLAKPASSERTELLRDCDQLTGRIQAVTERLAATKLVPAYTVSYPGERDLSKFERRYARVKYLARPTSLELLKLQLDSFLPTLDTKPLSASERAEQARRAAMWLARIARGEIRGMDIRPAESAIIAAIGNEAIGPDVMVAASHIPTATAQAALTRLILSESANMPLRIEAAHQLPYSLHQFGVLLAAEDVDGLKGLLDHSAEPVFHQALAAVVGSLKPRVADTGDRLRRFPTPSVDPNAAPAAPVPAQDESDTRP
jgi:CheY-like chemotaxis protein